MDSEACAIVDMYDKKSGIGSCKCSSCNGYISPVDKYCRYCGRKIEKVIYDTSAK